MSMIHITRAIKGKHRAATHIIAKLRDFRDLRTWQKRPKSDQKRPKLGLIQNQMSRPNTFMVIIAPVHDHTKHQKCENILTKEIVQF